MKPFFDTSQRIQSLHFHAAELVGTPFAFNAMVPGGGIDCIHVAAWCYIKTGLMQKFEPPKYALDTGSHCKDSEVLKWLDANPQFQKLAIEGNSFQPGDLLCFLQRASEHHVGIMLGLLEQKPKAFVHVECRREVLISDLNQHYYRRRVTAAYRPVE